MPQPTPQRQQRCHIVRFLDQIVQVKINITGFFVFILTWQHCVNLQLPIFVPLTLTFFKYNFGIKCITGGVSNTSNDNHFETKHSK